MGTTLSMFLWGTLVCAQETGRSKKGFQKAHELGWRMFSEEHGAMGR